MEVRAEADEAPRGINKGILWTGIIVGIVAGGLTLFGYVMNAKARDEYQRAHIAKLEAYARLPDLPLNVAYRKAFTGPGLVVALKNNSGRALAVAATFKNPTLGTEQTFRVDVPPMGTREMGHLEGWTFASGDTITIKHADYKTGVFTLP